MVPGIYVTFLPSKSKTIIEVSWVKSQLKTGKFQDMRIGKDIIVANLFEKQCYLYNNSSYYRIFLMDLK